MPFSSPDPRGAQTVQKRSAKFTTPAKDVGIISLEELRELRNKTIKGEKADAILISNDELSRIKNTMIIKTKDQLMEEKSMAMTKQNEQRFAATTRKEKMKRFDVTREAKAPQSDLSLEQTMRAQGLLSRAQQQMDEQHDEVKGMNKALFYAKVVTVRDKQLEESKQLEQEYLEEQKKLDLMMEIERLKGLQAEEDRETKRAAARLVGKQVIVDQIQERYQTRIKDNEIRDRERKMMKAQVEAMQEEEAALARKKQTKARQMLVDVEVANDMQKTLKQTQIQREKEEDEAIYRYNKDKQQREYEHQMEEKRIKDEKEKEVQKLRDLQEKAADRQGEIDAIRAKRAYEAQERNARQIEKLNHEKKTRLLNDLEVARKRQFMERETQLAAQAQTERAEFLKIIKEHQGVEARERAVADQKKNAFIHHKMDLKLQINSNSENKKQQRLDFLEEGRKIRVAQADEILKLETIKQNKMNQMQQIGISDKYQTELARRKIGMGKF